MEPKSTRVNYRNYRFHTPSFLCSNRKHFKIEKNRLFVKNQTQKTSVIYGHRLQHVEDITFLSYLRIHIDSFQSRRLNDQQQFVIIFQNWSFFVWVHYCIDQEDATRRERYFKTHYGNRYSVIRISLQAMSFRWPLGWRQFSPRRRLYEPEAIFGTGFWRFECDFCSSSHRWRAGWIWHHRCQ